MASPRFPPVAAEAATANAAVAASDASVAASVTKSAALVAVEAAETAANAAEAAAVAAQLAAKFVALSAASFRTPSPPPSDYDDSRPTSRTPSPLGDGVEVAEGGEADDPGQDDVDERAAAARRGKSVLAARCVRSDPAPPAAAVAAAATAAAALSNLGSRITAKAALISPADLAYKKLIIEVLAHGAPSPSRAGDVLKFVGASLRVPVTPLLCGGIAFPLLTCKLVPFRAVALELLWMLKGLTTARWLEERGVRIWSADADRAAARGHPEYADARELGPIYGAQWARQLPGVIDELRRDPFSRRCLVVSWSPSELDLMVLPPCHFSFQFVVTPPPPGAPGLRRLSCVVSMRSGDVGLGIPFNIASYALLLCLVARSVDCDPLEVVINIADAHVYTAHLAGLIELVGRNVHPPPVLRIPPGIDCASFTHLGDDPAVDPVAGWLEDYLHSGALKLPLLVGG